MERSGIFHEKAYPAGYFATSVLNISIDEINALMVLLPLLLTENEQVYRRIWPDLRKGILTLADLLRQYEPFSLNDWENEQRLIDSFFSKDMFPHILTPDSMEQNFFMGYVNAMVQLPLVLYLFAAAGWFFELDYLRRLKKRSETYFATAAHDCFNSGLFWEEMKALTNPEIAPFTLAPQIRSSYMFARNLRDKALMDNAYAEDSYYKRDMELDAIYSEARKRLAQKGGASS